MSTETLKRVFLIKPIGAKNYAVVENSEDLLTIFDSIPDGLECVIRKEFFDIQMLNKTKKFKKFEMIV